MKILILAPFLWSGAGAAITRLAIEFARRGKHCDVVSSGRSKGLQDWDKFILQLRRASIKYRTIDLFDRDPSSVWKSVKALIEIIEENEYDLIHVHSGVPAMAASIARDMIGIEIPIVATMHSWNPERPEWMNWADVWALNRCDKIVAVSESYKDYLIRNGVIKNKTLTIHLGTDIPALSAKKPKANKKDVFIVLSVGRIEKRKDQETLVRGFNLFRKQVKNAILEIVGPAGESEYETNLIRRMKRYGWDKNVHFKGMVKDTSSYFMKADLYISTSRDEGLGLALLEAMSFGIPSLSTPIAGHLDFARDGINTVEIPIGNYRVIAQRMLELYHNRERRKLLGDNARAMVRRDYSWQTTVDKYAALYEEALLPHKSSRA